MRCHVGMLSAILPLALATACSVTVPAPDLNGLTDDTVTGEDGTLPDPGSDTAVPDPGKDPGTPDPGKDPGVPDPGKDPGVPDPGGKDETPVDLVVDPGTDTVVVVPQKGGYPCSSNAECISNLCTSGFCTCRDSGDCDKFKWCDGGPTMFYGTYNCVPLRPNFAGCTMHEQCKSGACAPLTFDGTAGSYCAECSPKGGTPCPSDTSCCGGNCAQGCLGCAVAPPPEPVREFCASGCWDPATEFCGPNGPAKKLRPGKDCQWSNSWCLSGSCLISYDGLSSECSCDDSVAPCPTGTACFEGKCVGTP